MDFGTRSPAYFEETGEVVYDSDIDAYDELIGGDSFFVFRLIRQGWCFFAASPSKLRFSKLLRSAASQACRMTPRVTSPLKTLLQLAEFPWFYYAEEPPPPQGP